MRIPEAQLDLFAKRLESIGVDRRDFLKVVGAMAAFGGLGFATEARAAKPSKPGAGEKLAKDQTFRFGDAKRLELGGQADKYSPLLNKAAR